jgi:hypothetical protein
MARISEDVSRRLDVIRKRAVMPMGFGSSAAALIA